jgi:hypothetical protein
MEGVATQITTPEAEGGLCAVVEGDGFRDLALAPQGERATYGPLSTTCRSCLVREVQGEPLWLAAGGPGRVEWAGRLLLRIDGDANVAVRWADGGAVVYVGGPPGVVITVLTARPRQAVYRNVAGLWKRLIPVLGQQQAAFRVPRDADQPTIILLRDGPLADAGGRPPEIAAVDDVTLEEVSEE